MNTAAHDDQSNNPFVGLRAFGEDEGDLFFGRDDQVVQLLDRLGNTHFLAVVGASGSGKSSLIRAGLIPNLHRGSMTKAGTRWRVAVTFPGDDPIGNLAKNLSKPEVLLRAGSDAEMNLSSLEAMLRRSSAGLTTYYQARGRPDNENLLVVVDQFDELFRYRQTGETEDRRREDETIAFTQLLLEAAAQRDCPIYILLTVRSDFIGQCAEIPGLAEAINDGQYLVPRMARDDYREAIAGPVKIRGGTIAPRLVEQLLDQIGTSQDQLPVLQHALMRTWEYWSENRHSPDEQINTRHYDAVGAMAGALDRHADETYNELPNERTMEICRSVFRMITDGAKGTRRPQTLRAIVAAAGREEDEDEDDTKEKVIHVVKVFCKADRSFLRTANETITDDTIVDISHEHLMRAWKRLVQWIEEEIEDARMYQDLHKQYMGLGEELENHLADPKLQTALDWKESSRPTRAWAQRYNPAFDLVEEFLEASKNDRDDKNTAEQRKRNRVLLMWKVVAGVAAMALAAFIILILWGWNASQSAVAAMNSATEASEKAEAAKKEAADAEEVAAYAKNKAREASEEAELKRRTADKAKKAADQAEADAALAQKRANAAQNEAATAQQESEKYARRQARALARVKNTERDLKQAQGKQMKLIAEMKISASQIECHNYISGIVDHRTELTRMVREALQVARAAPLVARRDRQLGAALVLEAHKTVRGLADEDTELHETEGNNACKAVNEELQKVGEGIALPAEDWRAMTPEDEAALSLALSEVWRDFDGTSGENHSFSGVPVRALAIDSSRPNRAEVFYGLGNGDVISRPTGLTKEATPEDKRYDSGCDSVRSLTLSSNEDGRLLVVGCFSWEVWVQPIDTEDSKRDDKTLALDAGASITSLAVGHRRDQVLYATAGGEVGLIDLSGPREGWAGADIPGVKLDGVDKSTMAFLTTNRDGRILAIASHDTKGLQIARYSHKSGAWVKTNERATGDKEASAFAMDPAGTRVAVGLASGDVFVWGLGAKAGERRKTTPRARVMALAFDGHGQVAAAGADGQVYVWTHCDWDAKADRCGKSQFNNPARPPLEFEHDGGAWALGFGPAQSTIHLYSGDDKGKCYIWSIDSEDIYERLCAQIEDPLDEPTWRSRFALNAARFDEDGRTWRPHCPRGGHP
ncbi:MAG: AAA family ATPase [Myxococcota bacterium]